jgi:outer membrane protein assembly factor BamB
MKRMARVGQITDFGFWILDFGLAPVAVACFLASAAYAGEWTHCAGDATRASSAHRGPTGLGQAAWIVPPPVNMEYVGQSSPVVYGGRVFVNARVFDGSVQVANRVIAYAAEGGAELWTTDVDTDGYDSWSSPAADTRHQTVIVGTGARVHALDMTTGAIVWQTALERPIVNASPAVTEDVFSGATSANRVLITDYSGFGGAAKLYALNTDPYDAAGNPYQLGDIVWTADLPGASGNSPAYADGTVYVASTGGVILARGALDGAPRWTTDVAAQGYPQYAAFFGGVTVRNGYVYAASYGFYGGQNNSGLFKLDAATGGIVWVTACERTNSIPVVTDDGRVFLSGGIAGFGSAVKVQAWRDLGGTVTALWDTYQATGGSLVVGGRTHQPAYADGLLYAGRPSAGLPYGPNVELLILDTTRMPADPGFVVARYGGAGDSPALADGRLYSPGSGGLLAFAGWRAGDMNCDGSVDFDDINPFVTALVGRAGYEARYPECRYVNADCNDDGNVDFDDINPFVALLVQG